MPPGSYDETQAQEWLGALQTGIQEMRQLIGRNATGQEFQYLVPRFENVATKIRDTLGVESTTGVVTGSGT